MGELMGELHVSHGELLRFATAVFAANGMAASDAETVAGVLVWANARGVDSHGVVRIPIYLKEIKQGTYKPAGQPAMQQLLPATFKLECNRAPGPVCMMRAAAHAVALAETFGVATGLVSNPTHVGALGRYAQWIAERGHAAIVIVAGIPLMAYHGSSVASIATSPIAIAVPGPDAGSAPLLLDMSTSIIPGGRVSEALAAGIALPEGAAIDASGKPTTDAKEAKTLLPIGGAKGSGLSLLFECLTGVLAAAPIFTAPPGGSGGVPLRPIQNAMVVALNVAGFRALPGYRADIEKLEARVKSLPRQEGVDELLLPGERADRETARRMRDGIPLPEKLWAEFEAIAKEYGVPPLRRVAGAALKMR
jgi:ureidoglycolate dehydrogenase (NAD+)